MPPSRSPRQANAAFDRKVQELRDAGNFNVMVLFATEWTRKEPDNAAAWDELRIGYVHLRQYEDARSAAKKAVQLAPDDARMWRNLASVNMDLDDPEGALAAFEQASARNSTDVDSLHAIGTPQHAARQAAGSEGRASIAPPQRAPATRSPPACARASRRCRPCATPIRSRASCGRSTTAVTAGAKRSRPRADTIAPPVGGGAMRHAVLLAAIALCATAHAQNVKVTPLGTPSGRALLARPRDDLRGSRRACASSTTRDNPCKGADDPRLGTIHVVLVSHAHGDHIGDMKLKAQGAGSCDNPELVSAAPASTSGEIAAAKNAALVMVGDRWRTSSRRKSRRSTRSRRRRARRRATS